MLAIIFATNLEADLAIEEFEFKLVCVSPFKIYSKGDAILAISGIGPISAALCAKFICEKYSPKKIVNIGVCGALSRYLKVNEILKISKVISGDAFCDDVFNLDEDGVTLISVANPILKNEKRERFSQKAQVVDMEAYGILKALQMSYFNLDNFECIKIVSDVSESCNLRENIKIARINLQGEIQRILGL